MKIKIVCNLEIIYLDEGESLNDHIRKRFFNHISPFIDCKQYDVMYFKKNGDYASENVSVRYGCRIEDCHLIIIDNNYFMGYFSESKGYQQKRIPANCQLGKLIFSLCGTLDKKAIPEKFLIGEIINLLTFFGNRTVISRSEFERIPLENIKDWSRVVDLFDDRSDRIIYKGIALFQFAYQLYNKDILKPYIAAFLKERGVNLNHRFHETSAAEAWLLPIFGEYSNRNYNTYNYLLENISLLHMAVLFNDVELVRALCESNMVDVNLPISLIENGELYEEDEMLQDEGIADDPDAPGLIGYALESREPVHIFRVCGITALHLACRLANEEISQILIANGANPDATDSNGATPLDNLKMIKVDMRNISSKKSNYSKEIEEGSLEKFIRQFEKRQLGKPKSILSLGEAGFGYTASLVRKHPNLGSRIIATEYMNEERVARIYPEYEGNKKFLAENGVSLFFRVDARLLHSNTQLRQRRFRRIHFNCPHDGKDYRGRTLPRLIGEFFLSATHLQKIGDRIYMALPEPKDRGRRAFYQAYVYGLFEASARAGYELRRKRWFGRDRYTDYRHRITGMAQSAEVANRQREYIFVKTKHSFEEIMSLYNPLSRLIYGERYLALPEDYETEYDSSDYEDGEGHGHRNAMG